jgi:hypothetical protein
LLVSFMISSSFFLARFIEATRANRPQLKSNLTSHVENLLSFSLSLSLARSQ